MDQIIKTNLYTGWERVKDAALIKKLQLYSSAPDAIHESMWYQRWVGKCDPEDISYIKQKFAALRMHEESITYDGFGYLYIPRRMLQ